MDLANIYLSLSLSLSLSELLFHYFWTIVIRATYKALTTAQPTYLHSLISVQSPRATRSSSVVTLPRPPTSSSLTITNRSFRYASPHLWNQLPVSFRQPCIKHPADDVTLSNSPPTCSPLSPSITHSLFHSRLKLTFSTNRFHHSLIAPIWTAFSDYTGPDLLGSTVFHF